MSDGTTALDAAYEERNRVVAALATLAELLWAVDEKAEEGHWRAVVTLTAIEGWAPEWHNCVYITTPAGQLSWHFHDREAHLFAHLPHVPAGTVQWDGHSTPEKYGRLERLAAVLTRR